MSFPWCKCGNKVSRLLMDETNTWSIILLSTLLFVTARQDFDTDLRLRQLTIEFLEDLVCCPTLLPAEHKAASQLLRLLTKEEPPNTQMELSTLLTPPEVSE